MADDRFHCIILKGGDQYPYFPRPLLSEFEFSIPLASQPAAKPKQKKRRSNNNDLLDDVMDADLYGASDDDESEAEEEDSESRKLEQAYLLKGLQAAQLTDLVDATTSNTSQRGTLARLELDIDKTLLQLLAVECRESEDRGMRALELVRLMRDRTGRMIEAAGKVAERYGRTILWDKIREVGEERLADGLDEDEDF